MFKEQILTIILLLSPIYLIQFGMAIYSLGDLSHRQEVHGQRWFWAVLLILTAFALPTGIIASGLYLVWGRQTGQAEYEDD
jgi:hypothetical protein